MRISKLAFGLLSSSTGILAGCDEGTPLAPLSPSVPCRTETMTAFADDCGIAKMQGAEGTVLVLSDSAGGFRRLLISTDGRGVIAADGAEAATVSVTAANQIEVAIGGDRYRLPATVKARPRPQ